MLKLFRIISTQNVKNTFPRNGNYSVLPKCVHLSRFHNVRRKNDDVSSLFKPVNIQPSNDDINVGAELVGKLDKNEVIKSLNKFTQKQEIKTLCAENGLDAYLQQQAFASFRRYCIETTNLPVDLHITLSDILQNAGHLDDIFPYFLRHARSVFPHLECMDDLKKISDLRTPANWYPSARSITRKIVFHAGPTNSGKTYHAMERFLSAKSGVYCGPLKLLATEVFHKANERGTPCDLITGEERKFGISEDKPSAHVACTVEMTSVNTPYEVAVIDEIQLLKDPQRGWAWTRAFLGLIADEVHVCGEAGSLELLQKICETTNETVELYNYNRLTTLSIEDTALVSLDNVLPGDCIVCFSKNDIYNVSREIEARGKEVAVIYGGLPPGTKLAQAAKFNDPSNSCKIMVATDAIGMGLNFLLFDVVSMAASECLIVVKFLGGDDASIIPLEREQILQFEILLAAQVSQTVITEENSILIPQLQRMDPMGPARRPPKTVLDQLQALNSSLKLGHLLCRSRKPDLLLDIIHRQGATQSMPWLSDLVQNSEGDFNHLPVQCLCEFLLSNSANLSSDNSRDVELLNYLQDLLKDSSLERQVVCVEVLEYFFRRLTSVGKQQRQSALTAIKLLLKVFALEDDENIQPDDWLLKNLHEVPHFAQARSLIIVQLRAACQIENDPELVMIYIQFIAYNTLEDSVNDTSDHIVDMAQLIVERSTMFKHIIPITSDTMVYEPANTTNDNSRLKTLKCLLVMFNNYVIKLKEDKDDYEYNDYSDILYVNFHDGKPIPLHLNVIHAFIILLTHSSPLQEAESVLDYWFPDKTSIPQAFIPETNEPYPLLPDWLKLKMIRSPVERLVDAAMFELTPDQIVLFVQNFGTPINSMSKLLALLDRAVIEQLEASKKAILNKAYLAQLIEIQQARGAKNGHITVQHLGLHSHATTVPDPPKADIMVLDNVNLQGLAMDFPTSAAKGTKEVDEIVDLIFKTQSLNKLNSFKFRRLIHQLLGRDTSPRVQSQTSQKVFIQLMSIANSSHGSYFFQNIFHKAHGCTFFRAALSHVPEKQENFTYMLKVVDKIINSLTIQKSLKNATLMQILINRRKSFIKQSLDSKSELTDTQGFIQTMLSTYVSVSDMETKGRKYVQDMIDKKKTGDLVNGIVSLLKQCSLKSDLPNENNVNAKGILIDWLTEVDSELITVNKEQQLEVMFGVQKEEFRFYLLSLLCHQTNWNTLYETVTTLLSKYNGAYDSSAVLNFIEGIIKNPKLWQGRDRVVSKHEPVDLIYVLDCKQILVLVEYILNEGKQEIDSGDFNNLLHSRVSLFLKIVEEEDLDFVGLIGFVLNYPVSDQLKLKFLQQLYLMSPTMKFQKEDLRKVYTSDVQNLKGCRSDVIVTYLITTLGSLQNKKDFDMMSSDTETLIRKVAASHPSLFLRELKVVSSLLQGKAHMNIGVLRSEFHISRFIQILRLLELLQPHIFDDCYKVGFQTALECYFTFLKHHSRARESYHILIKFVDILQGYINKSPTVALSFMEPYTGLLQELSLKNKNFIALQQLVQGLSLLKFKTNDSESELTEEENKLEIDLTEVESKPTPMEVEEPVPSTSKDTAPTISETDSRGAASFALATGPIKTLAMSPHFIALVQALKMSSAEDLILQPLQEIENLTSKRSGYLDPIFHRLLQLIFSLSAQVRSLSYILLIRHLKHNPGKPDVNKATFSAYIQCLKDSNSTVALSAVDNLVDICILLQEYSVQILQVVFDLGITTKLSTCNQIKRCIQTIKLQHGC